MNRRRAILGFLAGPAIVAGGMALVAGDRGARTTRAVDEPYLVVTTIGQIADVARNIGGDLIHVEPLMGPGVDPHLYKASEGDVIRLLDAAVVLYNGLHLEGRMGDVLARLGEEKPVVAVAETIPTDVLLTPPEFQGQHDPHVWFDPTMWVYVVQAVADSLVAYDPANAETYLGNAEAYLAELTALDADNQARIDTIPESSRMLVTAHDAFNYFGRHYGLEVVGLQGISTESEAGVGDIQALADLIAKRQVPAIFVESSVSPRTIEALQEAVRDRGFEVVIGGQLYSDAMGDDGTPEGTYLGMVDYNVRTVTGALGGDPDASAE